MITPSKNAFQKKCFNITPLRKYYNITPQNMYFKIAPSKDIFQNCYKLGIENKNARYVNYSIFKKQYFEKLAQLK